MDNNKVNKTFSSSQGAYTTQPKNRDTQPAYRSKEKSKSIFEDLNNSKNLPANEAAAILNEIKFRKVPYALNMQKPKIAELKDNQFKILNKDNFYNSFAVEKERNSRKQMPVSVKGNNNVHNTINNLNCINTSALNFNLNNSNLNSSVLDTSFNFNRGNTDKSETASQKGAFAPNLPMHVNSISITSKNTKAQIITSDFNYYLIGAKKNKRNASSGVYANYNNTNNLLSKKVAYSRDSSENRDKRNQSCDYISNNTDNTSKKSTNENDEGLREIRTNNRNMSMNAGLTSAIQGQGPRGNYINYTSNAYAKAKSKDQREMNKLSNSHAVFDKDFSDDNLSSDVSEHKRKITTNKKNSNSAVNDNDNNKLSNIDLSSINKIHNTNITNFNEAISNKDAKSTKAKSKEKEFVIETQNIFSEISGLNLSNNVNNVTFMSNNNNTENLISDFNLQKHLSFDQEKANENLINFDEFNLFETNLNERITNNRPLREVNEILNKTEYSAFNQKVKVYFNNMKIEQDENFKYKKFLDEKFPPSYKSFFSMKLDNNTLNSSLVTDESDEFVKNKKMSALNSGKFNNIIFKRPSDVIEDYKFDLFAEKLENCVYAAQENYVNPAFNAVINTLISKFPFLIYRIFRTNLINYSGYYEVVLYLNNKWQIIYVDDFLPYDNKAKALFGSSQIWKLILEKAIAKASGGYVNYMLLEAHTLFNLITGLNSVIFENNNIDLFNYIVDCMKNNFCLCAKYPNLVINNKPSEDVYLALIDAFEIIEENNDENNHKIIKLRKPHVNFSLDCEIKNFDFVPKNKFNENMLQEITNKEAFDSFGYVYLNYSDFKGRFDYLYCCMSFVNDENLKKTKKKNNVLVFKNQKELKEPREKNPDKNTNETDDTKHIQTTNTNQKVRISKLDDSKEQCVGSIEKDLEVIKQFIDDCFIVANEVKDKNEAEKKLNLSLSDKKGNLLIKNTEGNQKFSCLQEDKPSDNKEEIPNKQCDRKQEKPAVKKEIAKPKRKGSHDFGPEKIDVDSEDEKKPSAAEIAKEREAFKAKFQSYINKPKEKDKNPKPVNAKNANVNAEKKEAPKKNEEAISEKPNETDNKKVSDIINNNNNNPPNDINTHKNTSANDNIKANKDNEEANKKKENNQASSTSNIINPPISTTNPTQSENQTKTNPTTNTTPNNNAIPNETSHQSTPIMKKEEKKSALKKLKEFEMGTSEFKKMEKMKQLNQKNGAENANKGLTSEQIYENLRKENKKDDLVNNIFSSNTVGSLGKKEEAKPEIKDDSKNNPEKKNENLVASLKEIVEKNKKKKWEDDNSKIELKRIEEEKRIKEIIEKNEREYEQMMQKGVVSKPVAEEKKSENENNSINNESNKTDDLNEKPKISEENKPKLNDETVIKANSKEDANTNCKDLNKRNSEEKRKEKEDNAPNAARTENERKLTINTQEQPKSDDSLIQKLSEKLNSSSEEKKINLVNAESKNEKQSEELLVVCCSPDSISNSDQAEEKNILPLKQTELTSATNAQQSFEKKGSLEPVKEIVDLSEFNTECSELHKGSFSAFKYFKDLKPLIYKGEKFTDKQFPPVIKSFIDIEKQMLKSPLNKDAKKTPSLFSNALNIINSITDHYDNSKLKAKLLAEIKTEDIIFKRASEVLDNFTIINRGVENLELTKSLYEQCLYCVLSVLANTPQTVFNLIRTLERNDYGYYEMNLFIDGIWQIFYVDDFFPFSVSENKFIGYANIEDQLWPMLLEKAFAKACGGYYEMYCTDCSKFLSAFTGMESGHVKIIKNDIFEFLQENVKKKSILISNTKDKHSPMSLNQNKADQTGNLKAAYFYVVLDAFEIREKSKFTKIIKIGSPWEKVDFEGEWGVNSPHWDETLKKKYFNCTSKTKYGYAFLTIDEFIKNFDTVFFCLTNLNNVQGERCDYFEATGEAQNEADKAQSEFPAENIKDTIYREDKDCFAMQKNHEYFYNQSINFEFTKRFTDPFFPPGKRSLLSFSMEANDIVYENARVEYEAVLKSQKYESIVWRRISEIENLQNTDNSQKSLNPASLSVLEDITSATKWPDVFDQSPTDGYFQTIIACLIKKPSFIDKLIRTKKINKFCYYEVLLYIDNAWKIIFVDDLMPFDAERGEFLGVRPYQNQIWPLILQKAWAKACGGYLNMSIMNPTSCLTALTGFESGLYETAKLDLFQFIYDSLKSGYYLMAKSKREHSSLGLQPNFYYLINNCFETSQNGHFFKLLKLRAPWKGFDWSGQWALQSPIWEEDKKQIMWKKSVFAKNGFFIVNYEEFVNNFDCLFFCFVNMNAKEENKLPNFQLEYAEVCVNSPNSHGIGGSSAVSIGRKTSNNSVNRFNEFKRSNSLSTNYADLQMMNLAISSSSYFSTTKCITPINGFNKYDNSAETLNIDDSESYYFWNLEARSTSNILDILISNSNKRKKKNEKLINFADTPSGVPAPKAHLDFIGQLLKTMEDFRSKNSKNPVSQDERNLIRLLKEEQNLVANLLFSLEPGSPLDTQWYYKELKNNGVWLSQYDVGNQHIAFHAVKKHIRMGIYKGNLQWGKSIIFDFFYDDEGSNFFYAFDGVNIDGQKQGEGKYLKKPGFNYYTKEVVKLNFSNDLVQTGKFIMPDGCVWNGPVKNDFYKSGTGTIKTPDGKSWQCSYNMDTFIK